MDAPAAEAAVTFVVRIVRASSGEVTGVVHRLRTGVKERFEGHGGLARVVARMVEAERDAARPGMTG
jgi:hypothetical protein